MRYTFQSEQWLPYSVDLVFAFFANPENLPRLMPKWQNARIEEATFVPPPPHPLSATTSHRSMLAGAGTKLTISFRPFPHSPIRIPWEAEISEFIWNDHFCDRQLRGPFSYWRHCHHLQPETRTTDTGLPVSGTRLRDQVEYELPLGKLGEIANSILVRRQLKSTFKYRHTRTSELLPLFVTPTGKR